MPVDLLVGSLGLSVILLVLYVSTRRPSSFPPGPPLLPFLGNLLSTTDDSRVQSRAVRKKYGDISSLFIFNKPLIFLSGYEVLRDALVKNGDVFCYRPSNIMNEKQKGILSTSGEVWREQRRFTLSTLRDLGMGRPVIENKIQEELGVFLQALGTDGRQLFNCSRIVHNAVSNIICSIIFGKRFEYTDPVFVRFLTAMKQNLLFIRKANAAFLLPLLAYLPGDLFKIKKLRENRKLLEDELVEPSIKQHLQDDCASDDFISAYIKEMQRRKEMNEETSMDMENLGQIISDLFFAGTDTTSSTLCWTLVYLLHHPDVQEKCFQEIKENVGVNRSPCMKDKTNLPYLEAMIMEVLRYAQIAPTTPPYTVSRDINFRGYEIKKGVAILPLLFTVFEDQELWGDPENFRPERFLDDAGKVTKVDELIPFSFGRRVCPGESLARMELFLFLSAMIQRYRFLPGDEMPSLDGVVGITCSPKPFMLKVVPRD